MNPVETLEQVAREVSVCEKCTLHFSRKNAVPGEGPANSEIVFIGEGPGFFENEQGRPFVGQAGKYLEELLEKNGLKRSEVFICNVVKCRPPGNRDPLPDELAACATYLDRQIAAINPCIIVTLGRFSMARYMNNVKISEVHGKPRWVHGKLIVPMYHPAAGLHQPSLKPTIDRDFSHLLEWVKEARQARPPATREQEDETEPPAAEPPATQLSLF